MNWLRIVIPSLLICLVVGVTSYGLGYKTGGDNTSEIITKKEAMDAAENAKELQKEAKLFTVPNQIITPKGPFTGGAGYDWQPPFSMQGAVEVAILFTTKSEIHIQCGITAVACELQKDPRKPLLILPNPCNNIDDYSLILCHELGHANGWPGDHRGGHFYVKQDMLTLLQENLKTHAED